MRYLHVRDDSGHPFATVIFNHDDFGVAVCGPRDQFSRKMGRHIAVGRLINKPNFIPGPNRRVVIAGESVLVAEAVNNAISDAREKNVERDAKRGLTFALQGV